MKKLAITLITSLVAFAIDARAQTDLELPDASQAAVVKQRIGVTDITIKYHRPLVNGRKIWGALVPYGKVWRAGANENTTFEISDSISIEGKPLPKGTYGLHMIPNADSWTIIFSKMSVAWGSFTYDQSEDALRVEVKPSAAEMEDALEYSFEDLKLDSATVVLHWEKIAVPFHVSVTDADTIFPSIRNQLRGRAQYNWSPLNDAANFALTKKTNLDEGLKWADQSIQNEERFENLSTKADLLRALNKPDEAKKAWDRALELSSPLQLYSYARRLQSEKRQPEAMEIFRSLTKKSASTVFGHLASARVKSAEGDFDGASAEAKAGQAVALSDAQKTAIQGLIDRLAAKQDINK